MKLLIVDDNQQNRYMLQVLLTGHGHEVVQAANGAEALETARNDPPDMIVTDILMPVMDGYALCRLWQKNPQLRDLPFVFYSATYTDTKDQEFALSLGAVRFIAKPQEPEVFLEMLEDVIAAQKAGTLATPREVVADEAVYLKGYNQALIRKLEDKVLQLKMANRSLEGEIAERQQAQASLTQARNDWETIFQAIGQPAIILDAEHGIIAANRAVERATGNPNEDLVGTRCWEVLHCPGQAGVPACCPFEQMRKSSRAEVVEVEILGGTFVCSCTPLLDNEGGLKRAILIATDITEQKRAEQELTKHRDHLEERVEERTAELRKMVSLMTGREVRMAGLKESIKKLRLQIERAGLTPVADDPLREL